MMHPRRLHFGDDESHQLAAARARRALVNGEVASVDWGVDQNGPYIAVPPGPLADELTELCERSHALAEPLPNPTEGVL